MKKEQEKGESKYSAMEKDSVVKRWLRNLGRGSPITAEVALRRLGKMCELLDTTPQGFLDKAKKDLAGLQDSLEDLVDRLEKAHKSPGYIIGLLKSIRSWLRYHDITLTRRLKVTNPNATPTIENEQIPSQEELSRILRASPPRIRVAEVLMAFADLRPESIGNFDGSDGLMLKDLPELQIKRGRVIFEKIPTMVVVRPSLSKARHKYFTFLSSEGCTYLKEYLEERRRSGERLNPESPLIGHDRPRASTRPFMLTRKITHQIRKCMRKAGVRKRPYVLRAYAETQLIIAESKGKISHPYLQFIAGHKGDIEARYSTNKGRLPPDMIEDIRESYRRCEEFLQTIKPEAPNEEKIKEEFKKQLLLVAGFRPEELDKMDLSGMKEDEFQGLVRQKLLGVMENNGARQKVVPVDEIEKYLAEGWEFTATLPNCKAVLKLPL